ERPNSLVQPDRRLTVWTGDMVDTLINRFRPSVAVAPVGMWAKASISPCSPSSGGHGGSAAGPRSGSSIYPRASRRVGLRPRPAQQAMSTAIDVAELDIGVAHAPVAACGLGDADGFADQHLADEDQLARPLDLAIGAHAADRALAAVLGLAQATGIGPGRSDVERGRRLLAEGLVGPQLVVLAPESLEARLLGAHGRRRRLGGGLLERPMHA